MGILNRIFGKKRRKNDSIRKTDLGAKRAEENAQVPSPAAAPKTEESGQSAQTLDERISFMIERAVKIMKEKAPEGPCRVKFGIPGTQNEGHLIFRQLTQDDWQLQVGANRMGTDLLVSVFLCHGEQKKVLEYLTKPDLKEEVVGFIKRLSDSVDEKN